MLKMPSPKGFLFALLLIFAFAIPRIELQAQEKGHEREEHPQETTSPSSAAQNQMKRKTTGTSASAKKGQKIEVGEFTVFGRIVKPRVQFIISREKGTADEALVLKESFVPRILRSVKSAPF